MQKLVKTTAKKKQFAPKNRSVPASIMAYLSDEERRAQVWEKRLRGWSYEAIANELLAVHGPALLPVGWNAKSVYEDCAAVLATVRDEYRENAATMVQIELGRFDKMLEAVWDSAEAGDVQAVDRVLSISRERRKMLGLDNPERFQVDWRIQLVDLLQNGKVTPEQIADEFGQEALIQVNTLMIEQKNNV